MATLGPESRAVLAEQTDRLAQLADNIDEVSSAEQGRLQLTLHVAYGTQTAIDGPAVSRSTASWRRSAMMRSGSAVAAW